MEFTSGATSTPAQDSLSDFGGWFPPNSNPRAKLPKPTAVKKIPIAESLPKPVFSPPKQSKSRVKMETTDADDAAAAAAATTDGVPKAKKKKSKDGGEEEKKK